MGIPLKLLPPRMHYLHGWGQDCHDARAIVCSWEFTIFDKNSNPATFAFDLVNGSSPLVIGLDVAKHCDSFNTTDLPHIQYCHPRSGDTHLFNTYIASDNPAAPDCIRIRVELLPRPQKRIIALLSRLHQLSRDDPGRFAGNVHRYTHAHPDQLKALCNHAGILTPQLEDAIDTTDDACGICVRSGRPLPSKKVSLSHVNEAFNEEVQIDFTYIMIQGRKHGLIVLVDTGTGYTECDIASSKNVNTIKAMYEKLWIWRHGASKRASADDEYHRRRLLNFFERHGITFKARPTRRHNKIGFVERKHGTLKNILHKLAMDQSETPLHTLVACATFLSNLFSGSQLLSSFELVHGYQPSLLGIPASTVTQELLEAHTQQVATRDTTTSTTITNSKHPNCRYVSHR